MRWVYRNFIRPILFTQDSESIHERTLAGLTWASHHEPVREAIGSLLRAPSLPLQAFGLDFPNPVGLAAGMDKYGAAIPIWEALGFGFTELGGVTLHAQPGNPRPRLFRVPEDDALINRMGFNNPGAEGLLGRLVEWKRLGYWPAHPIGINLGKSKVTPLEEAPGDYAGSVRILWDYADFFVVNVSSPNTPNLRQLQDKAALAEVLQAVQEANLAASRNRSVPTGTKEPHRPGREKNPDWAAAKPVLVKVAPDLSFDALDEILELIEPHGLAGIVATNTTIARPSSASPTAEKIYAETGGMSGRPLRARSTEVIRHLYRQSGGKLTIIGVGGVFTAQDAWEKIIAGATLVQIYTGLIYEGPGVASQIVAGLLARLEAHNLGRIQDAVGLEFRQRDPVQTALAGQPFP